MIEPLIINKRSYDLISFVSTRSNLYITEENKRRSIKSLGDLKALHKQSSFAIRKSEGAETKGLLFVWKSNGESKRNYIKIEYDTIQDVDDLLMVLNWNFAKEVYIKLPSDSPLINSFRRKGFKFCSGRGVEVMLRREKNDRRFIAPIKDEDLKDLEAENEQYNIRH